MLNWLFDAVCLWMRFHAVSDDPVSAAQVLLAFCVGYAAGTITIVPGGLGIIDSALILVVAGASTPPPRSPPWSPPTSSASASSSASAGSLRLIIRHRHRDQMTG